MPTSARDARRGPFNLFCPGQVAFFNIASRFFDPTALRSSAVQALTLRRSCKLSSTSYTPRCYTRSLILVSPRLSARRHMPSPRSR